jgi:hypothetical protein
MSVIGLCLTCVAAFRHAKWVSFHYCMERSQVVTGEESSQIWKVPANILNKQSWTADKERSISLGVGLGANKSPRKI